MRFRGLSKWQAFTRYLRSPIAQVVFLISPLAINYLHAQPPQHEAKHYTVDDGLGFNFTRRIVQDKNGFLWFDHVFSLTRFDGYEFKVYRHVEGDSLMQLGPARMGHIILHDGNLWVINISSSRAGPPLGNGLLLKYDPHKDGFIPYRPEVSSGARFVLPVGDSVIWLGTDKGGLFSFNIKDRKTTQYLNSNDGSLEVSEANNRINSITDWGSNLQLLTQNGVWLFSKQDRTFSRPNVNSRDSLHLLSGITVGGAPVFGGANWIINRKHWVAMVTDSAIAVEKSVGLPRAFLIIKNQVAPHFNNNFFWFKLGDSAVFRFDPVNETLSKFLDLHQFSTVLNFDHERNIWIGSEEGAWKYTVHELPYQIVWLGKQYPGKTYTLKGANQTAMIKLGAVNSIERSALLSGPLSFHPITFPGQDNKFSNFDCGSVGKEYFWVGTWGRGVIGFPIDHKSADLKTDGIVFYEQDPGNLPYTINSNLVTRGILETSKGDVVFSTYQNGLNRINRRIAYGQEGSVDWFMHDPADSLSISSNSVWSIAPGDDNIILVGTTSGLDLFDGKVFHHVLKGVEVRNLQRCGNGDVYVFTVNGLYVVSNSSGYRSAIRVASVISDHDAVEDQQDRLWISSSKGLAMYDPRTNAVIYFTDQPDLRDDGSILDLADGTLGLYSITGRLMIFDPSRFSADTTSVRPNLTSIKINNEEPIVAGHPSRQGDYVIPAGISMLDVLTLDYLHNNFTITFSAMEMKTPKNNLYRHKLEGFDKDWIETDYKNRTATYTSLPDGTYTFRVKASNHHGVWSDNERTLKVIILPPPWRTWWAYTGYLMLVAGALALARRNIVQRERLKSNLKLSKVAQEKEHFELEKAKEVDRVKTSFFTNISHEFRTPLTLIKGPVQSILDQFISGQQDFDRKKIIDQLKLVQRNSDLLLRLINQLLDLAKLKSGSLKIEKTEGDLYSFIRAAASSFESFARQKNISLQVKVPVEVRAALFDKDKLETILINLINNAIKFTPLGGKVTVSGACDFTAEAQRRGGSLRLHVADTGIGIPSDQQSKIFERFHQVSESHKEVGTGIGLSLVKELVALMGGTITVTSEPGKGSEFTVALPIELASSYKPQAASLEEQNEAESARIHLEEPTRIQHPATMRQKTSCQRNRTSSSSKTTPTFACSSSIPSAPNSTSSKLRTAGSASTQPPVKFPT